ncbi:unnamed protein product, partial [Ectocarpus sp. 4 AP-2014]
TQGENDAFSKAMARDGLQKRFGKVSEALDKKNKRDHRCSVEESNRRRGVLITRYYGGWKST